MISRATDERFMRMALKEAALGDFPFGALIVKDGEAISTGRNLGETNDDPTAHAEMVALRGVIAAYGSARLRDSTLYATGEPCPMCMGAIIWCGVGRLVYAASIEQLAQRIGQIDAPCRDLARRARFAEICIEGGLLADEALALFD
ncbi:nucleoside deaminase [Methylocella silvestris]|uniref:tRNA-specific adenosine deaminase n=1 Tax=Methylocella silvestris TaxID=199596 RepID=A0A2J7TFC4_METSI|nr:nucleoside deaminase [Methylocella silvestris]PNG25471.1 tRNA-specific adenosine deaminase [Methylocella silvestris]